MFCPYCGEENPDGARFCGACGKELPIIENPPVSPEKGETGGADDNAGAEAAAPVVNCGQPKPNAETCGHADTSAGNGRVYYDFGSETLPLRPRPKNHLVLAIVVAILFSRIFGILAIVFSAMTDDAWRQGLEEKAYRYSSTTKTLSIIGIVLGALAILILIVILLLVIGFGTSLGSVGSSTDWTAMAF